MTDLDLMVMDGAGLDEVVRQAALGLARVMGDLGGHPVASTYRQAITLVARGAWPPPVRPSRPVKAQKSRKPRRRKGRGRP